MKVAYFLLRFPDPYEPWMYDQMKVLLTRGHEVHIYSRYRGSTASLHRVVACFDLLQRSEALLAADADHAPLRLRTLAQLAALFLRRPSTAAAILLSKGGSRSLKTQMALSFRRYWECRSEYAAIYASPGDIAIDVLPMVQGTKARLIVGFQGHDLFRHSADSYRAVLDRADLAIAVSSYCGRRLTALGCSPTKIAYIPFGVDLEHFQYVRRPERQSSEAIKLVSVGRLSREKGHHIGINAVSQLVDKYNLTYAIVGDGPEHRRLQSQIVELGLQDRIFLVGLQDHDVLVETLHGAHLCIAPSITTELGSQEPYGVMIREAAATGCPVIATDIGGLVDGVISEETGLLIPENDVRALCQAIGRMIQLEPRWGEIGLRARRLMEERCDLRKLNNRFIEAFEPHLP